MLSAVSIRAVAVFRQQGVGLVGFRFRVTTQKFGYPTLRINPAQPYQPRQVFAGRFPRLAAPQLEDSSQNGGRLAVAGVLFLRPPQGPFVEPRKGTRPLCFSPLFFLAAGFRKDGS
jgi:hypothetical protein